MEIHKAKIDRQEKKGEISEVNLILSVKDKDLKISLTEDNPGKLQDVFNALIQELKKGEFEFELIDDQNDLFYEVSNEYIKHLNSELKDVFKELTDYELTSEENEGKEQSQK